MAHHQEVMGFNPDTVYWTDVSLASCYIIEKYINKGSHMGKTKKTLKFKKNELLLKKINFEKNLKFLTLQNSSPMTPPTLFRRLRERRMKAKVPAGIKPFTWSILN